MLQSHWLVGWLSFLVLAARCSWLLFYCCTVLGRLVMIKLALWLWLCCLAVGGGQLQLLPFTRKSMA